MWGRNLMLPVTLLILPILFILSKALAQPPAGPVLYKSI